MRYTTVYVDPTPGCSISRLGQNSHPSVSVPLPRSPLLRAGTSHLGKKKRKKKHSPRAGVVDVTKTHKPTFDSDGLLHSLPCALHQPYRAKHHRNCSLGFPYAPAGINLRRPYILYCIPSNGTSCALTRNQRADSISFISMRKEWSRWSHYQGCHHGGVHILLLFERGRLTPPIHHPLAAQLY